MLFFETFTRYVRKAQNSRFYVSLIAFNLLLYYYTNRNARARDIDVKRRCKVLWKWDAETQRTRFIICFLELYQYRIVGFRKPDAY